jgi:hypothetical protein
MRRCMGRMPRMTVPPMAHPALTMTNKHANPADERGQDIGVPKSRVGIGDRGIGCFHGTGSLRFPFPCLALPDPLRHTCDV